jgi:hypothetical protein
VAASPFRFQAKRGKIDSAAGSPTKNIATILDQVHMALRDPVWDPETNRRNLLDHVIIISAGEITKAARRLIGENLDIDKRRHILFMDRDDLLNLWVRVRLPAPGTDTEAADPNHDDSLPF